jgi:hypothetical protein
MNPLVQRVVAEWVLTNGKLPGFEDRVKESQPHWNVVDKPIVVYRAQGGDITYKPKGSPGPGFLVKGIRPILATSKVAPSTLRYANERCCVFAITLQPGTRYIDVDTVIRGGIDEASMMGIRDMCPSEGPWPHVDTPIHKMKDAVQKRCEGRTIYSGTEYEEIILPEHELMVYALDGDFSPTIPTGKKIAGRALFKVSYGLAVRGRGRTFRTNTLRRSKNGYRPPRKSQNRRDRKSRHRRHPNPDV